MLVHNLAKKFKSRFVAVKGVSFSVAPGECFGLLGINGAGKTTTFRMLTGDEIPTSGDVVINQYRLWNEKHKVGILNKQYSISLRQQYVFNIHASKAHIALQFLAQIGYCPQFDGINETLTGREMLKLFASLRGVSRPNVDNEINKWLSLMGELQN
jgi:ABC-type multidrug transport system ATPase subunit